MQVEGTGFIYGTLGQSISHASRQERHVPFALFGEGGGEVVAISKTEATL
jgi:hypothetical protein